MNSGNPTMPARQVGVIHLGYRIPAIFTELVRIRDYYSQFPFVRRCAIEFGAPETNNDLDGLFKNLVAFVKNKVRYVPDPVGFEWVTAPDVLLADILQKGIAYGDCDCHCLLLNTLLASVGFQTRFIAVKLPPATGQFDHVICGVLVNSRWTDVDTCAKSTPQPQYVERLVSQ